jgi:hypothetical protein
MTVYRKFRKWNSGIGFRNDYFRFWRKINYIYTCIYDTYMAKEKYMCVYCLKSRVGRSAFFFSIIILKEYYIGQKKKYVCLRSPDPPIFQHMWSSFKILIEDLRLSSNVAVTVTKYRKLLSKNKKSGKKPVATKLYGNDAHMIHFQTYGC